MYISCKLKTYNFILNNDEQFSDYVFTYISIRIMFTGLN